MLDLSSSILMLTPAFTAPERFADKPAKYSFACDVYSLVSRTEREGTAKRGAAAVEMRAPTGLVRTRGGKHQSVAKKR